MDFNQIQVKVKEQEKNASVIFQRRDAPVAMDVMIERRAIAVRYEAARSGRHLVRRVTRHT